MIMKCTTGVLYLQIAQKCCTGKRPWQLFRSTNFEQNGCAEISPWAWSQISLILDLVAACIPSNQNKNLDSYRNGRKMRWLNDFEIVGQELHLAV